MMATSVDTFIPTMNMASTKVIAEVTTFRDDRRERINEPSLKQQAQLTSILLEKLPGLTLGDYAHILIRSPDLTEHEKEDR